ncbi:MAG: hypothetical protein ACYSX0_11930 [Planctomycetota bacterium]|jgi:hypothetical protein
MTSTTFVATAIHSEVLRDEIRGDAGAPARPERHEGVGDFLARRGEGAQIAR